jgi:uncharacterized protein (DUF433 family)
MGVGFPDVIVRDPAICGGEPVVRGARVPVRTILASLAEGAWIDEILTDFPTLTEAKVRAVIAFAAASAGEDLPVYDTEAKPVQNGDAFLTGELGQLAHTATRIASKDSTGTGSWSSSRASMYRSMASRIF